MKAGDIVKAFVPQTNGQVKPRPAVLIKKLPYFDDWLICGIPSQTHTVHEGFDLLISKEHPEFERTGLPFDMVIRAGWLHAFPEEDIEGVIGHLGDTTIEQLKIQIAKFISS